MIKGILLKRAPHMKEISELEILGQLDPLKEYDQLTTRVDPLSGSTIYRRSYYSDDLYISTYASIEKLNVEAIWDVYNTLNEGAGDYIKAFMKDENTIVVAWPRYEDKFEDAQYTLLIEEITRVSAFFMKEFGINDDSIGYLRNYIDLCVSNGEN
jgi:hypothetical protein